MSFFQRKVLFTDLDIARDYYHMIWSVLIFFVKVAHVGSNQQLTCVYIPWHKPIILTELNEGQHVSVYVIVQNTQRRY